MKQGLVSLLIGLFVLAHPLIALSQVPITATTAKGKLGIIGDSIASGTDTSQMCGNEDIVDCMNNTLGVHSRDWSYAGGTKSWSIASLLGYSNEKVVDASDDGEEWKDALEQARAIVADTEVETLFIGLGANDVCKSSGHDYTGDLQIVSDHIDDTLTHLTDHLPPGGRIYWTGVLDVSVLRDIMRDRDHNYVFENCQATWDLDSNKVKDDAVEDACDHYFDGDLCGFTPIFEEAKDLLVELILERWLDIQGVEEGPCGKVLDSRSTELDRQEARQFNLALNQLMAQKAQAYDGRNGVAVFYNDRIFDATATLAPYDVSRLDCYHPNRAGQAKLASEIWRGFDPNYDFVTSIFFDEFDSKDYCNQEFTTWPTCWTEIGESCGPEACDIQIEGEELRVRNNDKGIWRGVDLDSVEEAWVSFNFRREDLDNNNDYVSFDVSPDNGQTWFTFDQFKGDADEVGMHRGYYYDISPYATAQTRIRLLGSSHLGDDDKVFFDNVKVLGWIEAETDLPQRGPVFIGGVGITGTVAPDTTVNVLTVPPDENILLTDIIISNPNAASSCCAQILGDDTIRVGPIAVQAEDTVVTNFGTGIRFTSGTVIGLRNDDNAGPLNFTVRGYRFRLQ